MPGVVSKPSWVDRKNILIGGGLVVEGLADIQRYGTHVYLLL